MLVYVTQYHSSKGSVLMRKFFACFVFTLLVTMLANVGVADARTYKFYAIYPEESFITQGLIDAAKEIKTKTNGKISIKVFPNSQLGTYEDAVEEVRQGTIDFAITYLTKRFDKRLELVNLPGLAPLGYYQQEAIWYADNSPFKTEVEKVLTEIDLVSLGPWPEPYATLFFAKGKRPEKLTGYDNKKRNIRAPGQELYREPYAALGYQMVTMDYSEIFNAMQTGQIDGTTGLILEHAVLQGKDIVYHIEYTKINCNPGWLLANKELWNSFSNDEKKIISETIDKYSKKILKEVESVDKEHAKILRERGVEVVEHPDKFNVERAAYLRKNVWPKHKEEFGADLLKKLNDYVETTMKK